MTIAATTTAHQTQMARLRAARVWIAFAILSAIWGSSYLFIRVGLRQLSPLALVGLRLACGAIVITIAAVLLRQNVKISRLQAVHLFILATVNTSLPFLLISWGEVTVPSGIASVLNSTMPIFGVLLAGAVLRDEPLTLPRFGGVLIGFAGVITLLSRDITHSGIRINSPAGQGAIVLASLCYAVGAVYTRRTLRGMPSLAIGMWVLIISALQTLILSVILSPPDVAHLRPLSVFAILWLGVLGSGIAYMLSFFILQNWGASRYALVAYMLPIVGLTLGAVFLSEVLDWRILAGSALVVAGVALASISRRAAQTPGDLA